MRTRPVFESYSEFVNSLYTSINEAESGGTIDALNNLIGGLIAKNYHNSAASKNTLAAIIKGGEQNIEIGMNSMMTPSAATQIVEYGKNIANYLNENNFYRLADSKDGSNEDGLEIRQNILSGGKFAYPWLVAGTVKATGNPIVNEDGTIKVGDLNTGTISLPLSDLCRSIFAYNLGVLSEFLSASKSEKKPDKYFSKNLRTLLEGKFLQIEESSMTKETLRVIPFSPEANTSLSVGSVDGLIFRFLVYNPYDITVGGGEELSTSFYEDILPPVISKGEEVKGEVYNSSGTNFFAENKVVISTDGISALNAIISGFNSISEIVVNGGASNKNTAREGGNEKLAQDRRAAGMAALTGLKDKGIEQLKGASIKEGEAKVQDQYEPSDPANQQVTFVISGFKKSTGKTETEEEKAKPKTIKRVEEMTADSLIFTRNTFIFGLMPR